MYWTPRFLAGSCIASVLHLKQVKQVTILNTDKKQAEYVFSFKCVVQQEKNRKREKKTTTVSNGRRVSYAQREKERLRA